MNTPQHFQLINGTFTAEQARRILGAMVKSKIDFHTLERHSEAERTGESVHRSEERLRSLRDLDADLKELFESARASGKRFEVKGDITITAVD